MQTGWWPAWAVLPSTGGSEPVTSWRWADAGAGPTAGPTSCRLGNGGVGDAGRHGAARAVRIYGGTTTTIERCPHVDPHAPGPRRRPGPLRRDRAARVRRDRPAAARGGGGRRRSLRPRPGRSRWVAGLLGAW